MNTMKKIVTTFGVRVLILGCGGVIFVGFIEKDEAR